MAGLCVGRLSSLHTNSRECNVRPFPLWEGEPGNPRAQLVTECHRWRSRGGGAASWAIPTSMFFCTAITRPSGTSLRTACCRSRLAMYPPLAQAGEEDGCCHAAGCGRTPRPCIAGQRYVPRLDCNLVAHHCCSPGVCKQPHVMRSQRLWLATSQPLLHDWTSSYSTCERAPFAARCVAVGSRLQTSGCFTPDLTAWRSHLSPHHGTGELVRQHTLSPPHQTAQGPRMLLLPPPARDFTAPF